MIYLLFYGFFLVYIATGVYQPLNALYHFSTPNEKSEAFNSGIRKYLLGVLIYTLILIISIFADVGSQLALIYLFGVPWIFIFWFYMLKMELKKSDRSVSGPFQTLDDMR